MPDPLFPLPDPGLLFVFSFSLHPASQDVDAEGVVLPYASAGIATKGYIAAQGRTEGPPEIGEVHSRAVALLPQGTLVRESFGLSVPAQAGLDPLLAGWWSIVEVRPNPSHIRAMLVKDSRA